MKNRLALFVLACLVPLVAAAQSAMPQNGAAGNRAPRATVTIINLNTADAPTLAREMDGIGDAKARAIVEHRQRNGAFRSIDDLALVKGIGSKTVEANRSRLTVAGGVAAKTPVAVGKAAGKLAGGASGAGASNRPTGR